ncbi:hypothetical protein Ancab_007612 [Ancistrocladus abbreviatus]
METLIPKSPNQLYLILCLKSFPTLEFDNFGTQFSLDALFFGDPLTTYPTHFHLKSNTRDTNLKSIYTRLWSPSKCICLNITKKLGKSRSTTPLSSEHHKLNVRYHNYHMHLYIRGARAR